MSKRKKLVRLDATKYINDLRIVKTLINLKENDFSFHGKDVRCTLSMDLELITALMKVSIISCQNHGFKCFSVITDASLNADNQIEFTLNESVFSWYRLSYKKELSSVEDFFVVIKHFTDTVLADYFEWKEDPLFEINDFFEKFCNQEETFNIDSEIKILEAYVDFISQDK